MKLLSAANLNIFELEILTAQTRLAVYSLLLRFNTEYLPICENHQS